MATASVVVLLLVYFLGGKPGLSVMVDVSVAIGTGALAVAAVLEVVNDRQRRAEDGRIREEDRQSRLADRAANIRVIAKALQSRQKLRMPGSGSPPSFTLADFHGLELHAENVGPGIAGDVSVDGVCVWASTDPETGFPESDYDSIEDLIKGSANYAKFGLSTVSRFLPVGADNTARLFDPEGYDPIRLGAYDSTRFFIVRIHWRDLEGRQERDAMGGVECDPPPYPPNCTTEELEQDDHSYWNRTRWRLATQEFTARVWEAYVRFEATSGARVSAHPSTEWN